MSPEPEKQPETAAAPVPAKGKPWRVVGAPVESRAFLHPEEGTYWETVITDGAEEIRVRGKDSKESLTKATQSVERRNK